MTQLSSVHIGRQFARVYWRAFVVQEKIFNLRPRNTVLSPQQTYKIKSLYAWVTSKDQAFTESFTDHVHSCLVCCNGVEYENISQLHRRFLSSCNASPVKERRRAQIKQLAWPMAEWQIRHRKSRFVLSARFPVVNGRSRSVACSRRSDSRARRSVGSELINIVW